MSIVNKVALALCNAKRERACIPDAPSLDVLTAEAQADYRSDARAAIEAMVDPILDMIRASDCSLGQEACVENLLTEHKEPVPVPPPSPDTRPTIVISRKMQPF